MNSTSEENSKRMDATIENLLTDNRFAIRMSRAVVEKAAQGNQDEPRSSRKWYYSAAAAFVLAGSIFISYLGFYKSEGREYAGMSPYTASELASVEYTDSIWEQTDETISSAFVERYDY